MDSRIILFQSRQFLVADCISADAESQDAASAFYTFREKSTGKPKRKETSRF